MSDDADDTREKSILEDDPDPDAKPETKEQMAERIAPTKWECPRCGMLHPLLAVLLQYEADTQFFGWTALPAEEPKP